MEILNNDKERMGLIYVGFKQDGWNLTSGQSVYETVAWEPDNFYTDF